MKEQGPQLDRLTHRLSECPPDFLAEPRIASHGTVHVDAVINDVMLDLGGEPLAREEASAFSTAGQKQRGFLRLALIAAWLLHDAWFRKRGNLAPPALAWINTGLGNLAAIIAADAFVSDPDRREELVRACLAALGLRPEGESIEQAEDRMRTLDSIERIQVIRETREKQEQARKLHEAMKQKEALEAAAKATRE